MNCITIITKWKICKIRNKIKFDNVQLTTQYILDATVRKIHAEVKFLGSTKSVNKIEKECSLWNKTD